MGKSSGGDPFEAAGQAEGGAKGTARTRESDATQATFPSRRSRSPPKSVLIVSGNAVTSHILFDSFLTP